MSSDETDSELKIIQVELEKLNTATDGINKLEIELEEANSTFRILLNESTRRLKNSSKNLSKFIEKARPYYDAFEKSREAQIECQKAADKFRRANEIHAAAKETVALAEERFMSNSHEWPFDSAWQEMLNNSTQKVMDADTQKSECHAEHLKRAKIFNDAKRKVEELEKNNRKSIAKSREYFIEKQICQDQLQTQKNRIQELQQELQAAKANYSTALRNLERISEEIHEKRGDLSLAAPSGPREPGVGADAELPDITLELQKCESDFRNGECEGECESGTISSTQSDIGDEQEEYIDENLEILKQKVKTLAVRPVESGDGRQEDPMIWENELNATVSQLDHLMMIKEWQNSLPRASKSLKQPISRDTSLPATPEKFSAIKKLQKIDPLPIGNSSMRELPLLETISKAAEGCGLTPHHLQVPVKQQRRRSLD